MQNKDSQNPLQSNFLTFKKASYPEKTHWELLFNIYFLRKIYFHYSQQTYVEQEGHLYLNVNCCHIHVQILDDFE